MALLATSFVEDMFVRKGLGPGDKEDHKVLAGSRLRFEDWIYESNASCHQILERRLQYVSRALTQSRFMPPPTSGILAPNMPKKGIGPFAAA